MPRRAVSTVSDADYIKMSDVQAIRQELTSDIVAATGVMSNFDRILIGGKEQDVKVIGTDQDYQPGAQYRNQQRAFPG